MNKCITANKQLHADNATKIKDYVKMNDILTKEYERDLSECSKIFSDSEIKVCEAEASKKVLRLVKDKYNCMKMN